MDIAICELRKVFLKNVRHLIYGVVLGLCNSTVINIGCFYLQHHKIEKSFNALHCASFIHNFFLFLFFVCLIVHTYLQF